MVNNNIPLFVFVLTVAVAFAASQDATPSLLYTYPCTDGDTDANQIVTFNTTDQTLRMSYSGLCLDVSDMSAGSTLQVAACHPSNTQQWEKSGNTFRTKVAPSLCVGSATPWLGAKLVLQKCDDPSVQWQLASIPDKANTFRMQQTAAVINGCLNVGVPFGENPCALSKFSSLPFCDTTKDLESRLDDFVSRLTTEEKLGLISYRTTAVGSLPMKAFSYSSEALHGLAPSESVMWGPTFLNATSFPQVCLTGATFDKDLFAAIGKAIGLEARVFNNVGQDKMTFWAPNINIFRDPRWGRGQETPGEDPVLTAAYATQFVRSFQYNDADPKHLVVSSCCKHWAAYSLEDWNGVDRHHFDGAVSDQDFADT
eukprot:PhM_4_TR5169/c1_g1_i1/m.79924/K15920/XYL4; beta-D-xylosidase 4